MDSYKQRALVNNNTPLTSNTPVKLFAASHKFDDKHEVQNFPAMESSPDQRNRNINVRSIDDLFTPLKINSDFYDTSHLDEFDVVNMLHDSDDILNLDNENMCCTSLDFTFQNINHSETEASKSKVNPLFMENENNDNKLSPKTNSSPVKTSVSKLQRKSSKSSKYKRNLESTNYLENEDISSDEKLKIEADNMFAKAYNSVEQIILSPKTIQKIENLKVHLTHNVPHQHKIENYAGLRPPSAKQRKTFETFQTMLKGKFSNEEDTVIKNNWQSFCKIHNWDENNVQPFLFLKQNKLSVSFITERRKFVQFLANGLPHRTLYSVYYRFKNLFCRKFYPMKGRFKPEEDKKILLYMNHAKTSNQKFSELSKILGRKSGSIWLRYQKLKKTATSNPKRKKQKLLSNVSWTVPLIEKFLQNLMEVTLSKDIIELKNAILPKVIWKEMERRMLISNTFLQYLWQQKLHLQLFSPIPIYLNDIKIKLIKHLYETGVSDVRDIEWIELCSIFEGMTTAFICEIVYRLVRHVKKQNISTNFTDILNYLHDVMIPYLKDQSKDKYLPRLSFKDGTVKVLEEDEEHISITDLDSEFEEKTSFRERSMKLCTESEKDIELEDDSNIVWTLPKRKQFLITLLSVMICTDIEELRDAVIPKVVWQEMEKTMKINKRTLSSLWYKELHLQLFSPNPIYLNDLRIKLINLIYNDQITDLKEVFWSKVCRYFDGMTIIFLVEVFIQLVNFASKEIHSHNFHDIMEYLHNTLISKLKRQRKDRYLPRILFENNTIKVAEELQEKKVFKEEEGLSSSSLAGEFETDSEINWTLSMLEKFIHNLLFFTYSKDIEELKNAIIPKVIWDEIEQRMNVNQKDLRDLWYFQLHMQLFCSNPVFMNDIKIKLIEYFYNEKTPNLKQIIWLDVCKYFDGFTPYFLKKIFYHLLYWALEEIDSVNFHDIIEYLYQKKISILKSKDTDRVLPRISYENGSINFINDAVKE